MWEAHAEAIKAADKATVFGHPCLKVYTCLYVWGVSRSSPSTVQM